jgi:hypothetical protein
MDDLLQSAATWFPDQMITRVETLINLLETQTQIPTVIYGHCDCGCDRTGKQQ